MLPCPTSERAEIGGCVVLDQVARSEGVGHTGRRDASLHYNSPMEY